MLTRLAKPLARRYGWSLAALSLTMLLPSLGISVANVALPNLREAFSVSSQNAQWVVIAYLVVVTSSLVTAGRLGDLIGRRRLLLIGIAIFVLASMAAMIAGTIWVVVVARAIQGVGAAMMMSLTVAAVGDAVPAGRSGMAMGLLGTVSAIGTAAGPSLGGLLVGLFGWPSIFALLAAAGLFAMVFVASQLPADAPSGRRPTFDVKGALLLMLTVAAFALATTMSPPTAANGVLCLVFVLGAAAFVRVEGASPAPLVRLEMVRKAEVAVGLVSICLVSAVVMTTLVVGPFYLTGPLALAPATAGLVMSVGPTVSALVGVPAGRMVDRYGASFAIPAGLSVMLAGTMAMTELPMALGVAGYVGSLVLITSGYALFQAANNTILMANTSSENRGVASSLLALARNTGLIAGASAMGSLFAFGSEGVGVGDTTGLQLAFLVASGLAALALGLSIWPARRRGARHAP